MIRSASSDAANSGRQSAPVSMEGQETTMEQPQPSPRLQPVIPKQPPTVNSQQQSSSMMQTTTAVPQTQGSEVQSQARQNLNVPPVFKAVAKEPQGQQRTINIAGSSAQRKRSRMGEEGGQGLIQSVTKIHELVDLMNAYIESLKNGQRGNTGIVRIQILECMKGILAEATSLLAKMVNIQDLQISYLKAEKQMKEKIMILQEENNNVKQQVIDLQVKGLQKEQEEKIKAPLTYAQMVNKTTLMNIITARQMPLSYIAQSIKHAPAECIIIFKATEKGEMVTKQEQEKFRKEIKEALGDEVSKGIIAIRPTRYRGHTLIFQSEKCRDIEYESLRKNEKERGIGEQETCMLAPMKRVAKVVCKQAPEDITIQQIKQDMFGKHNPALQLVNNAHRTGKIYRTRLGLVFELSSHEMAAIQSQDWRIRCDVGREMRVEEFISLQQCYACSKVGHSANECKVEKERCRLCGKGGHAGKNCPDKNNKEAWRCANCQRMNLLKNMNLDEKHAAAQLHKCPVAIQQKTIRKMQLASTGMYTTPIQKGEDVLKERRPENTGLQRPTDGVQLGQARQTNKRNNRSQSIRRKFTQSQITTDRHRGPSTQRQEARQINEENLYVQRAIKIPRPRSTDGWRVVGRREERKSDSSERGRRSMM